MKLFLNKCISLSLAVCMLFSFVSIARAEDESAKLLSLSLSGLTVLDFDPDSPQREYTAYIPCDYSGGVIGDGLTVPDVYYEKASEDASVEVNSPSTIEENSVITITVTNGSALEVYTINLVPIGKNLYENGGFEEGDNTHVGWPATEEGTFANPSSYNGNNWPAVRAAESAYTGEYGLKRYLVPQRFFFYRPAPELKAGKQYLASQMMRYADANFSASTIRVFHETTTEGATLNVKVFENSSAAESSLWPNTQGTAVVSSHNLTLGSTWKRFSSIIKPSIDAIVEFKVINNGSASDVYTDDYYMGELVVGSANMTNKDGEVVTEITKPLDESEVETVALTANFYNQLGTKVGLDNLEIGEFALAENYEDVSINEEGILSVGCNAPEQIKIITYADTNFTNHVQQKVKAEIEIDVRDISDLPVAEVNDVKIRNMSVPNFKSRKFNYSMYLPYNYEPNFPERILTESDITTFVADEETTCDITVGDGERDEDYLVTIDATNGDVETQYTIKVYLVGENMVIDGGLENGDISIVGPADGPTAGLYSLVEENVGVGNYALRTETSYLNETKKNGCTGWGFTPRPVREAGVRYITSFMFRLDDPEGATYSLMNWSKHAEKPIGTVRYDIDGMEQITKLVPVTPSWQTCRSISTPSEPGNTCFALVDPAWTAGNQPTVVSDEHYMGELVIGSINYNGTSEVAIPETGEKEYALKAEFFNQFGDTFGLEDETVIWDLAGSFDGVRVENGKIIVTDEAVAGSVRVRATIEPAFNANYTFSNSFELELVPESDTPEIPRADNVKAAGVIKTGETLVGSYDYYNALGIDEGESQYAWFYSDTKNGTKTEIPADYDTNEDGDGKTLYIKDETYANKYIFFEVTPYTVEGEDGKAVVSNYVIKPTAPTVSSITITGNGYVGSTAVATYTFADENGDEEDGTTYRWLRGSALNGTYVPIEDAEGNYFTEKEYTITTADIGKYLRFEVTPKTSATYEPDGVPTVKNGVLAAAKPKASNVKIVNISGNNYRVEFLYSHPLGITEGVEKIQWYADGIDLGMGVSKTIDGTVNTITVRVIPVASKPPYDGEEVTATLTLNTGGNVVNKRPASDDGGYTGGPSIYPVPEAEPIPEQKPTEEAPKHWAADGIEFVINNGIMQEVAPNDFQNGRIVTRAEFIYYVMKTLGSENGTYNNEFADVSGDDYFAGALQVAVDSGIISKDTNFNPQRSVSRQEVCKILVLAASLKMQQVADLTKFVDEANVSEWAKGYVGAAVDSGLLKGVSENEFSPLGAITREQTAVILKRLNDYRKGGKLS